MKPNAILTLGTGALLSLGLLGGAASMALADTSAVEAKDFLAAPGSLSTAVFPAPAPGLPGVAASARSGGWHGPAIAAVACNW